MIPRYRYICFIFKAYLSFKNNSSCQTQQCDKGTPVYFTLIEYFFFILNKYNNNIVNYIEEGYVGYDRLIHKLNS